jgi:hypothetical protein
VISKSKNIRAQKSIIQHARRIQRDMIVHRTKSLSSNLMPFEDGWTGTSDHRWPSFPPDLVTHASGGPYRLRSCKLSHYRVKRILLVVNFLRSKWSKSFELVYVAETRRYDGSVGWSRMRFVDRALIGCRFSDLFVNRNVCITVPSGKMMFTRKDVYPDLSSQF